jgi:hypothetical protein
LAISIGHRFNGDRLASRRLLLRFSAKPGAAQSVNKRAVALLLASRGGPRDRMGGLADRDEVARNPR